MPQRITSTSNPTVKRIARLQTDSGERKGSGLFCVESRRELGRAMDAKFEVESLFVCTALVGDDPGPIARVDAGIRTEVNESVLEKLCYRNNPEGFVALLRERKGTLEALADKPDAVVVVCSAVEKPGNIGAILRSADGAGIDAVLIDNPGYDLFNPNCVRASTGAVFTVPVVRCEREAMRDALRGRGYRLVAASPEAENDYTDVASEGKIALVLGAEDRGLDAFWRGEADVLVRVPMHGVVDSLNVSVTAALLMFEAARRRLRAG